MRVLVQRVRFGGVHVEDEFRGKIGHGLVLLVGVHRDDDEETVAFCADKCTDLRIFADEEGKMNRSILDVEGEIVAVSQFTLYGDCRKGRRPSFVQAAPPKQAEPLYNLFVELLRNRGVKVVTGEFGASMLVEIHNEGPVTVMVESPPKRDDG
jgi:D-tyrosyl-tRNA(Tyr) deacylase